MGYRGLFICGALLAACYQAPSLTNGSIECGGVHGDCPSGYTCGCDGLCRATASARPATPDPLPPPVERPFWEKVSAIGRRNEPSLVYDPVRRETLLFSGEGVDAYGGDTWIWNGSRWSWRTDAGPAVREAAASTFDHARGEIVLFSGDCPFFCQSAETWLWNGSQWSQAASNGPQQRSLAAMVDDEADQQVVLFGGRVMTGRYASVAANDLWAWNGAAWSQLCTLDSCVQASPIPRSEHGLAYDRERKRIVLFGGVDNNNVPLGDTWEWDGTAWTQMCTSATCMANAPTARSGHAMYYDSVRNKTVIVGGYGTDYLDEVWEWDGTQWTLSADPRPPARYYPSVAFDDVRGVPVLFGGYSNTAMSVQEDTWERQASGWMLLDQGSPGATHSPGVTYDTARGRAVFFGGSNGYADDYVWEWTSDGRYERTCPQEPCDRQNTRGGMLVYDEARAETLQFTSGNELWALKNGAWSALCTSAAPCNVAVPPGRALAYDRKRAVVVIAGGTNGDTWEWDGSSFTQKCTDMTCMASHPTLQDEGTLTYDRAREVVVHYNRNGTTWQWDGVAWTKLCATSPCSDDTPGSRFGHSLAYDPARRSVLLFGGYNTVIGETADIWEWTGTAWRKLSSGGALPREDAGFVFDEQRGRAVMFGGASDEGVYWLGDTWEFHMRGGACTTGAECDSGFCTDGVCCDQAACGSCEACNVGTDAGQCVPLVDRDDPDTCTGAQTCGPTGACALAAGQTCSADEDCASARCSNDPCDRVCE